MLRHTKIKLKGENVELGFETKKTMQPRKESLFAPRENTLRMHEIRNGEAQASKPVSDNDDSEDYKKPDLKT